MACSTTTLGQPRYLYVPLPPNSIRLLELLPSDQPTQRVISGRIHVSNLDSSDCMKYECLSYAWGEITLDRTISILDRNSDGVSEIAITKSLLEALVHIRPEKESLFIWIDQICINQEDIMERSSQVAMMRRIFQSGERTLAWLGVAKDDKTLTSISNSIGWMETALLALRSETTTSPATQQDLPQHEAGAHFADWLIKQNLDSSLWFAKEAATEEYGVMLALQEAVKTVMNTCSYFQRAWIIQEFVVANDVIMIYGSVRMSHDILFQLSCVLGSSVNLFHHMVTLRKLWKERGNDGLHYIPFQARTSQLCLSTDPRDKIYSFLGLVDESIISQVKVDYRRPFENIYLEFSELMMKDTQSLDSLGSAYEFHTNIFGNNGLPAWCPNWDKYGSADGQNILQPFHHSSSSSPFVAARGLPYIHDANVIPGKLLVKGKRIGVITRRSLVPLKNLKAENLLTKIAQILEELGDGTSSQRRFALFRTALTDMVFHTADEWTRLDVETFYNLMYPSSDHTSAEEHLTTRDWKKWGFRFADVMTGLSTACHSIFEANGLDGPHLGLGYEYFQPGDIICLLHGSAVPIALRPTPVDNEWIVLGQCYYDGWMFGEYADEGFWTGFEKVPDSFVLV